MAYTRKYFLQRVKEVNEIYVEYHSKGVFNEFIYKNYIKDKFHISRSTFYEYLTIPYASQLKQIELKEKQDKEAMPSLFFG